MNLGQIRHTLNELANAQLELSCSHDANLETEVAQQTADVVLNGDRLLLQQLAGGQQYPPLLTGERFHMHRPEQVDPHHLGDAPGIIPVSSCSLELSGRPWCDASRCTPQAGLLWRARRRAIVRAGPPRARSAPRCQAGSCRTCRRSSGWLATLISRQIFPVSSTIHTDVSLTETSRPA